MLPVRAVDTVSADDGCAPTKGPWKPAKFDGVNFSYPQSQSRHVDDGRSARTCIEVGSRAGPQGESGRLAGNIAADTLVGTSSNLVERGGYLRGAILLPLWLDGTEPDKRGVNTTSARSIAQAAEVIMSSIVPD